MLLVSKKINGGYSGRFNEKAKELVLSGKRVGMIWISGEKILHCHICNSDFNVPKFEENQNDHFGECTKCKTPFVFAKVEKVSI